MAIIKKPAKKMQMGGKTSKKELSPEPKKKTGMDALKGLGEYVKTFGYATEGYNPAPSKKAKKSMPKQKNGGLTKAKSGGKFPDLNKDGKITKADILKGRGVIAKKGASIRKAKLGDILGKVAGSGAFGLAGMAANKLFGGKKKAAPAMGGAPMGAPAAVPAVAPMKKGGKISAKKKMMKSGGKMSKCRVGCN